MKGFPSKRIGLKVDVSQDRKIYSMKARPCVFQPGGFTGCGSEGVKAARSCTATHVHRDGQELALLLHHHVGLTHAACDDGQLLERKAAVISSSSSSSSKFKINIVNIKRK